MSSKTVTHAELMPPRRRRYTRYLLLSAITTVGVYFHQIHPYKANQYKSAFDPIQHHISTFSHSAGPGCVRVAALTIACIVLWAAALGLITVIAHEFLHYIAIPSPRKNAHFTMNWGKFTPGVIPAIRLSRSRYIVVALLPLVVIDLICIAGYFTLDSGYSLACFGIFLLNTIGAAADYFAAKHVWQSKASAISENSDSLTEHF